jgi:hypothetical protein
MFLYRRANGKWILIHQDYEMDMGIGGRVSPHASSSWDYHETLYQGWNDHSMQTCELPPVATAADAEARGCAFCHDSGRAKPLRLPTQITPTAAARIGCRWSGVPETANATLANALGCTSCHVPTDPKMALSYPTKRMSGDEMIKVRCRRSSSSSLFDAFVGAFKDELDKALCRLTLDGTLSEKGVLELIDEEAARLSPDAWMAGPAVKQFCGDPMRDYRRWDCELPLAHDRMRAWARGRTETVMRRLKCR